MSFSQEVMRLQKETERCTPVLDRAIEIIMQDDDATLASAFECAKRELGLEMTEEIENRLKFVAIRMLASIE